MRAALLPLGLAMAACAPDFPDTPTLVDGPRILGVRGEPAEVQPGDEVTLEVLVASPAGEVAEPAAFWSLCLTPKPPAENGPVNPVCWDEAYQVIGGPARSLSLQIPDEACQLFGPETPPGDFRPRDADASGGYYQPIRVSIPELAAFAFERVQCGLSNAAADVSIEYRDRYLANRNPEIAALEIAVDGAVIEGDQVPAGARLTLTARWSESDAEVFPVLDVPSQTLVDRREALRVSWFATAGSFDAERSGRSAEETETFSDNGWQAPDGGVVHIWAVLRDSRGGSAWASRTLTVR